MNLQGLKKINYKQTYINIIELYIIGIIIIHLLYIKSSFYKRYRVVNTRPAVIVIDRIPMVAATKFDNLLMGCVMVFVGCHCSSAELLHVHAPYYRYFIVYEIV